jgi:hypothetical protein
MVSLSRRHSGKRVEILLRCCACDQVRFDLGILKPEALERSPDDIILDSEEAPDGNTEISGKRFEGIVTLPCEERERTTPQRFLSGRDDLVPRTHRRGA